jgi:hypothetical protein
MNTTKGDFECLNARQAAEYNKTKIYMERRNLDIRMRLISAQSIIDQIMQENAR